MLVKLDTLARLNTFLDALLSKLTRKIVLLFPISNSESNPSQT